MVTEDDKRNLFNSALVKRGIHQFLASNTDDSSAADDANDADSSDPESQLLAVYGEGVVNLYKKAKQNKFDVTLDVLSQAVLEPDNITAVESILENTKVISTLAATNRKLITNHAGTMLTSLPKSPLQNAAQIDGLLAAHLADPTPTINRNGKRDQWGYAATRGQSYATNSSKALFSTTTVRELTGDTVHFMMFQQGSTTKIECFRFGFMDNPLAVGADGADPTTVMGDPAEVDDTFVEALKLPADWKMKLPIHAKRLEMVQHVLKKLGPSIIDETHAQALFQHVLGELVQSLDGDIFRVVNVDAGTANMRVIVQVCNQYLKTQGKPEIAQSTGQDSHITIRSDLVVTNVLDNEGKLEQLLGCLYNIEMEAALDKLMHSAIRPKSQLIAESLARSLKLKLTDRCPGVLWSALCDCFCIHILVHFPGEKKSYLSHREVEPGRIVCIVAWLHMMSKRANVTLKDFKDMGFTIGNAFEEEIRNAATKRTADKGKGQKGEGNKSKKAKPTGSQQEEMDNISVDRDCDDVEMHIDMGMIEEMEIAEARAERMSTFSSFQNYYRFGDPLPATEAVMRLLENQEICGEDTCHDRLARVGMQYSG